MTVIYKILIFSFQFSFLFAQPSKGQKVKNINTVTTNIEEFNLYEVNKNQPVLLIFYRGFHSQPCNKFLKNLASIQSLMDEKNILTVVITPDSPLNIEKTQQKILLPSQKYVFIHDFDCKIMQDYEVDIPITKSKENFYKISGFANNKEHFILPMSSTILIDTNQTVLFAYHSKKPRKRPSIKTLADEISKINS
ncbi:MAG: redoxin domain-containing protein [Candidatus Pacearchaeota archaeon]